MIRIRHLIKSGDLLRQMAILDDFVLRKVRMSQKQSNILEASKNDKNLYFGEKMDMICTRKKHIKYLNI